MRGEWDIQYCPLIVAEPSDPDTRLFQSAKKVNEFAVLQLLGGENVSLWIMYRKWGESEIGSYTVFPIDRCWTLRPRHSVVCSCWCLRGRRLVLTCVCIPSKYNRIVVNRDAVVSIQLQTTWSSRNILILPARRATERLKRLQKSATTRPCTPPKEVRKGCSR